MAQPIWIVEKSTGTNITPGSTGWQALDLTTKGISLPDDTVAIFYHVYNSKNTQRMFGIRHPDCPTSEVYYLGEAGGTRQVHTYGVIGVGQSASDWYVDIYCENITDLTVHYLGYMTSSVAKVYVNPYGSAYSFSVSMTTSTQWLEASIPAAWISGSDTPKAAIMEHSGSGGVGLAYRPLDDTADPSRVATWSQFGTTIVKTDSSGVFEWRAASGGWHKWLLRGYIKDTATTVYMADNLTDICPGSTGWQTNTSQYPSNAVGSFLVGLCNTANERMIDARADDSSNQWSYFYVYRKIGIFTKLESGSGDLDLYTNNISDVEIWDYGYFISSSSSSSSHSSSSSCCSSSSSSSGGTSSSCSSSRSSSSSCCSSSSSSSRSSSSSSSSLGTSSSCCSSSSSKSSQSFSTLSAIAWGESSPAEGELHEEWTVWKESDGQAVSLTGDGWSILRLDSGEAAVSRVIRLKGSGTRAITVTQDKYGSATGTFVAHIRGSSSSFEQLASSPAWQEYTHPVNVTWNFIQLKLVAQ